MAAFMCHRYILNDDELSDTFDLLDMDKDGWLNRAEVGVLLRTIKVEPTRHELDFVFSEMDREKTGKINKASFVEYLRSPPIHRIKTIGELEQKFKEFDADGDGRITEGELRQMLAKTAKLTDQEAPISDMFQETDRNGDGKITFREFVEMMKQ